MKSIDFKGRRKYLNPTSQLGGNLFIKFDSLMNPVDLLASLKIINTLPKFLSTMLK